MVQLEFLFAWYHNCFSAISVLWFKGEKQTSLAAVTIHLNRKARALRLKKNCLISWSFLVEIRRSLWEPKFKKQNSRKNAILKLQQILLVCLVFLVCKVCFRSPFIRFLQATVLTDRCGHFGQLFRFPSLSNNQPLEIKNVQTAYPRYQITWEYSAWGVSFTTCMKE